MPDQGAEVRAYPWRAMTRILFVCRGNMVRSQIAEALYRKYRDDDVSSAGLLARTESHDGLPLRELGLQDWIRALQEMEGIDISQQVCKQITEQMVHDADRVVVMAQAELWPDVLKQRRDLIRWDHVLDNGNIPDIIGEIKALVTTML